MFSERSLSLIQLAAILSASYTVTDAAQLSFVKKALEISITPVNCLESIQFEDEGKSFRFPEELQPLTKHPLIADLPGVHDLFESISQVNQPQILRMILPTAIAEFYVEVTGNFTKGAQLLEIGLSVMRVSEPGDGEILNSTVVLKEIGSSLEGTQKASDPHIGSSTNPYVLYMLALLSKQSSEMERLKTEISGQKAEFLEHKTVIGRQKMNISEQGLKILEQDAKIRDQATEISKLRTALYDSTLSTSGTFIWKISNYTDRMRNAKSDKKPCFYSKPFLSTPNGYKLRAVLCLDGTGDGKGTHLSVFIQLLPGEFDSVLGWPFTKRVSLTLMDQKENTREASYITKSFVPDPSLEEFQRPSGDFSSKAHGYRKFVSQETLGTRHYVKDDTIFFKVQIS